MDSILPRAATAALAERQRALVAALRGADQPPPPPTPHRWAFERLCARLTRLPGHRLLGVEL